MAIVEELLELEDTSTGVVDFAVMAPPKQKKPADPPPESGPYNPSRHGNLAQWVAPAITLLIGIVMVSLQVHYRNVESSAKSSDEHINSLIDAKLNPAVKGINDNIEKKLGTINGQLEDLNRKVGEIRGKLGIFSKNQEKISGRLDRQASLAKVIDPDRVLATIRLGIEIAEKSGKVLPTSDLVDYKNVVQELPNSAYEYWTTVAAIINYQSLINQMSGEAPDPTKVARPCIGPNFIGNTFSGATFRNCVVSLDTNSFEGVTFQDSVIQYRGGPVGLANVRFVNCRFVLKLAAKPATPAQEKLLFALLNSPDQTIVQVPN